MGTPLEDVTHLGYKEDQDIDPVKQEGGTKGLTKAPADADIQAMLDALTAHKLLIGVNSQVSLFVVVLLDH